jgi:sulfate permease, SulP family
MTVPEPGACPGALPYAAARRRGGAEVGPDLAPDLADVRHNAVRAVPVPVALALMVGLFQIGAGLLRLGALVDFISTAVVLGYISGAGVLIGLGQLHNFTGTQGPRGSVTQLLRGWVAALPETDPITVSMALGTVALIVLLRRINRNRKRRIPAALVALVSTLAINLALGLESHGLAVLADLSSIPAGLPPFTIPSLDTWATLLPVAVACTVLSLVESTAMARSIASRTGEGLDASTEFFGQGMANLTAAFVGGYPISGSLSRSALAERTATSRVAGITSGLFMLVVLLFLGPILDHTPIAALAGLLVFVAYDLVDVDRIRRTVRSAPSDALAFAATMAGTWILGLDLAIYLGVGISLVLFLRKARLLEVHELVVTDSGLLQEVPWEELGAGKRTCGRIRILQVEGTLFFGAAGELRAALDEAIRDREIRGLVVRVKRAKGLDGTTAAVFESVARTMREQGRTLFLVGLGPEMMEVMDRSGASLVVGPENLFPRRKQWFGALDAARERAVRVCGGECETCPFATARFTHMVEATSSGRFKSLQDRPNDLQR